MARGGISTRVSGRGREGTYIGKVRTSRVDLGLGGGLDEVRELGCGGVHLLRGQ